MPSRDAKKNFQVLELAIFMARILATSVIVVNGIMCTLIVSWGSKAMGCGKDWPPGAVQVLKSAEEPAFVLRNKCWKMLDL